MSQTGETSAPRTWLLAAALAVAAAAPCSVALDGGWIFDDNNLIVGNPYVHSLGHASHWFTSHFWDVKADGDLPQQVTFWRPLVLATYALDWTLGSGSPFIFHLTNLLLHATATVLSFLVLKRWLGEAFLAFFVTLLFSVHPFRTESVAWISGRPDPLMMIGVLIAIEGISMRMKGRKIGFGVSLEVVGTAIAYGSKEHAVVLPVLALVEVWTGAHRSSAGWHSMVRPLLVGCGAQVLVAGGYVLVRQAILPMNLTLGSDWTVLGRVAVVMETLGRYAKLIVWPQDLTLGAGLIYLDGRSPRLDRENIAIGTAVVTLASLTILWGIRRKPVLSVALLALAGTMFPISNAFSLGYYVFGSPRLFYLPAFPLALVTGILIKTALDARGMGPRRRTAVFTGLALIAAVLGTVNVRRSMDYQSADRFWWAEAERNPRYFPALQYFTLRALRQERPREALQLAHVGFGDVRTTFGIRAASNFLVYALVAVARLTPDLDHDTLLAIHRFLAQARAQDRAELEIRSVRLRMDIPPGSPDTKPFRTEMGKTLAVEVGSRVGLWGEVQEVAAELLASPSANATAVRMVGAHAALNHDLELVDKAINRLRSGAHPEADELVEAMVLYHSSRDEPSGPLRAAFYVRLFGWGKAYHTLGPHLDGPPSGSVELVAEVAFRAGDERTARRLLKDRTGGEIEELIARWQRSMQWKDSPLPSDQRPVPVGLAKAAGLNPH